MLKIGCHLSSSKGFLAMGKEAVKIGANTFQFFTRNPRGSSAKALNENDIQKYLDFAQANNLYPPLAHAPYTLNPCSADSGLREFAINTMRDDLLRLEYLPGCCYNFHPGSHVQQGAAVGIRYISEALNAVIQPEQSTMLLLETMSGKGSEIGRNFAELQAIIVEVRLQQHLGVCLDTCHIFDAGYDIVDGLDAVLEEFDRTIGLDKLRAIHINDSLNLRSSHKDRHAQLGQGNIGIKTFEAIINHPALCRLPFYLETPNDLAGYAQEIALLKSLYTLE